MQLRVEPREPGGARSRDWVPRLRVGDPRTSGDVAALWEGAVAIPRDLFERVGRWPEEFRFVHEGVDLAWRVLDAGPRVRYARRASPSRIRPAERPPSATATRRSTRPATASSSPAATCPLPLGALFVASFVLRTLPGLRTARAAAQRAGAATAPGCASRAGRAGGCARARSGAMTRLGRPPIL